MLQVRFSTALDQNNARNVDFFIIIIFRVYIHSSAFIVYPPHHKKKRYRYLCSHTLLLPFSISYNNRILFLSLNECFPAWSKGKQRGLQGIKMDEGFLESPIQ